MGISMQVIYPALEGSRFDHDYYAKSHLALVEEHLGAYLASTLVTKGQSGGPGKAAGYHAIATLVFADEDAFRKAMKVAGPVLADVPNYTDVEPEVLIGEVVA